MIKAINKKSTEAGVAKQQRVVIVGGGFGGVKAALELAKDERFRITLISDKSHFLYYPALYSMATGGAKAQSVVELEKIFAPHERVTVVRDTVTGIDAHRRHIVGASGKYYDYDRVVLSLGVVTSYFGIKGLDTYSYSIKSKEEVERLKAHLHGMLTADQHLDKRYVVVGAGPTGVELAAALASYLRRIAKAHGVTRGKVRLSLVEAAPRILPRMSEASAALAAKRLKDLGVDIQTNARVEAQDDDELFVNGRSLKTHTVIWTSGVSNHPLFAAHDDIFTLAPNGRVAVDEHLQAHRDIYVIGDNAATPYTGLAQTALHDAIFVAKVLRAQISRRPLPTYRAVKPPVVVPVGENWAVFEWGGLRFGGIPAALMRRAADAIGYSDVLPLGQAIKAWQSEQVHEESCGTCKDKLTAGA